MAVTAYSIGPIASSFPNSKCFVVTWAAVPNGNTGAPFLCEGYPIRTCQVTGTFGAAGSVTFQGSNDGVTWVTINDILAAAPTFTSAGMSAQLAAVPLYIRPSVTAGDGTTALNCTVCFQKAGTS